MIYRDEPHCIKIAMSSTSWIIKLEAITMGLIIVPPSLPRLPLSTCQVDCALPHRSNTVTRWSLSDATRTHQHSLYASLNSPVNVSGRHDLGEPSEGVRSASLPEWMDIGRIQRTGQEKDTIDRAKPSSRECCKSGLRESPTKRAEGEWGLNANERTTWPQFQITIVVRSEFNCGRSGSYGHSRNTKIKWGYCELCEASFDVEAEALKDEE
ncbi:hypothetical protein DFH09DRAFT_1095057 [Mycena vulgaris]|nr:hypothetical protein DFH09DRAFT_1095057 [Mycena vulgaris]